MPYRSLYDIVEKTTGERKSEFMKFKDMPYERIDFEKAKEELAGLIQALKEAVYDLIQMTTQKDAGQRKAKGNISWDELEMTLMSVVIEATALVLSGDLDKIEQIKI